jgi:hypothetical protein
MRFNELEKKLKRYRVKMSTPTFVIKIKELLKLEAIKKVERSRHNVGYFVNVAKLYETIRSIDVAELLKTQRWVMENQKIIKAWPIERIVTYLVNLLWLKDLYLVRLLFQDRLKPMKRGEGLIQAEMIDSQFQFILNMILEATEATEREYEEIIEHLNKQIKERNELLLLSTNK